MTDFEVTLLTLSKEASDLQKKQIELRSEIALFDNKLQGFLKENGLPENFTLPELALLAIRKSRS